MPLGIAIIIFILFVLVVLFLFVAVMVAPARASEELKAPFINRYFAHRGLHNKEKTVPENSLAAFSAACDAGYGIELDVRLTSDNEIVISHDDNLKRVTGEDVSIEASTYSELAGLKLGNSDEHVPRLSEVLELVGGRVPLIIEVKPCENKLELCRSLMTMLAPYTGDYCLESFDPEIVRWIRYNMPIVLRGQLSSRMEFYKNGNVPWFGAFFMSRCLSGLINRPHFIAYEVGPKPWPIKLTRLLGAMHVTWTSRPKEMGGDPEADARNNDVVIFEHYLPPQRIAR